MWPTQWFTPTMGTPHICREQEAQQRHANTCSWMVEAPVAAGPACAMPQNCSKALACSACQANPHLHQLICCTGCSPATACGRPQHTTRVDRPSRAPAHSSKLIRTLQASGPYSSGAWQQKMLATPCVSCSNPLASKQAGARCCLCMCGAASETMLRSWACCRTLVKAMTEMSCGLILASASACCTRRTAHSWWCSAVSRGKKPWPGGVMKLQQGAS